MKERDDLKDGINWQMESAGNLDKVGSYKFSIIIEAATAEDFINQYFKNWDGFVKTDGYASANSPHPQNDTSFLSEWKWPVISIPIIISIIYLLEHISNR